MTNIDRPTNSDISRIMASLILSTSIITTPILAKEWNLQNYKYYHDPEIATTKKAKDGRGSTFFRDPFVWAYSADFAKRYGMPEEWIDNDLKGAEAIAFRHISTNYLQCGFFRNKDACRAPIDCHFDLYIPKTANLPWVDDRVQGFHPRIASRSMHFLKKQKEPDQLGFAPQMPGRFNMLALRPGIQSMGLRMFKPENVPLALGKRPKKHSGYYGNSRMSVQEFDRSFLPDLDYVSANFACSKAEKKKGIPVIGIDDYIVRDNKRVSNFPHPQAHQIIVPRKFMDRVNIFHEENYDKVGTLYHMIRKHMREKNQKQ